VKVPGAQEAWMKLGAKLATTVALGVLLAVGTQMLRDRYGGTFGPPDAHVYGVGQAPEDVRRAVLDGLRAFQEGYLRRDVGQVEPFVGRLFSRDDVLLLGTMPLEARASHAEAVRLVRDDWTAWGDCRFAVDQARISSHGDVAWFATVGYVTFDLSRLLVLPLRLSGVLVKEEGSWRFRQLQFQLDLDTSWLLLLNLLLALWLAVSLAGLAAGAAKAARRRQALPAAPRR